MYELEKNALYLTSYGQSAACERISLSPTVKDRKVYATCLSQYNI